MGKTEPTRLLKEELFEYSRDGFLVRHGTETTTPFVKPKKFSFL